jgi:tetratricopeptide (TPR) repeat protein
MPDGKISDLWKWVGYITALLSLIAGVRGLTKVFTDRAEARHKIESLMASEHIQAQGHDYSSAWQTLEQASQVDPNSAPIHTAQENLAMQWLDNIHVRENERFSDVAEKLDPVLTRGATATRDTVRQADLLAHLGWSYFLRSRDGIGGLDPSGPYADAARKDPNNPYAQAMWGHWILWNGGELPDAATHFSAALRSNRERNYVRDLQLSALLNAHTDAHEEEIVRVLNEIRKEQVSLSPDMQRRLFSMYYGKLFPPDAETPKFINAVPPAEHVATFRWFFDKMDLDQSNSLLRAGYLSVLQEAAGQREEALAGYQLIRRQLAGRTGSLLTVAEAGTKRLSRPQ